MRIGTSTVLLYNIIIFTPMGIVAEGMFLISGIVGWIRFYGKSKRIKK